jgi:hypothetical protein
LIPVGLNAARDVYGVTPALIPLIHGTRLAAITLIGIIGYIACVRLPVGVRLLDGRAHFLLILLVLVIGVCNLNRIMLGKRIRLFHHPTNLTLACRSIVITSV